MPAGARIFSALLMLLMASGCHTMRFEVADEPHARVVYDRKAFFLGGLVPTKEADVSHHCPAGVAAIREETRFSDGVLGLITLSIYQPRSSWYYCLGEGDQP